MPRAEGKVRFLDPRRRSHTDSMGRLSDEHWERVIRDYGLETRGAVLDVACGSGDWLPALAQLNARVVGTDIGEAMLELARARSGAAGNVELACMAAEELAYPDATFDAVTCFTALPYLDQERAVAEIARVLRPGGRLVIGTVGSGYYAKHVADGLTHRDAHAVRYGLDPLLVSVARAVAGERVAAESLTVWSPRRVRRLLTRGGFTVERVARDVAPADPRWPRSFLGRPVYFVVCAHRSDPVC
jgi:SAM-dependent methyltransferase